MYSPPSDLDTEQHMRAHHAHIAKALDVTVEPGTEFWRWAGRILGAPARTATGGPAWLRRVSAPDDKARPRRGYGTAPSVPSTPSATFGGHRPAFLAVHDAVDSTA